MGRLTDKDTCAHLGERPDPEAWCDTTFVTTFVTTRNTNPSGSPLRVEITCTAYDHAERPLGSGSNSDEFADDSNVLPPFGDLEAYTRLAKVKCVEVARVDCTATKIAK